jgi:hypothetical protein
LPLVTSKLHLSQLQVNVGLNKDISFCYNPNTLMHLRYVLLRFKNFATMNGN